jgi:hypothetical protein
MKRETTKPQSEQPGKPQPKRGPDKPQRREERREEYEICFLCVLRASAVFLGFAQTCGSTSQAGKTASKELFLINTSLQRGDRTPWRIGNRFNGFKRARKAVETARDFSRIFTTSLKRSVAKREAAVVWESSQPPMVKTYER